MKNIRIGYVYYCWIGKDVDAVVLIKEEVGGGRYLCDVLKLFPEKAFPEDFSEIVISSNWPEECLGSKDECLEYFV